MSDKTFIEAAADKSSDSYSLDGTEPIPFTGDPGGSPKDYAATFAEHSTGAGYPSLDGNGNLVADVTLRTGTANELVAIADAGDGEIAVCTDVDAICIYTQRISTVYPRLLFRNGNFITYIDSNAQLFVSGDSVVSLTGSSCYPPIVDETEDSFIIEDYMRAVEQDALK